MTGFIAVFRKEMAGFFVSPVAYCVIASFLLIFGFFFWANMSFMSLVSLQAMNNPMIAERVNLTDIVVRPLLQNMGIVLLFVIPLLTMRVFAEEKKVAKKSSIIVEKMIGCERMKRTPFTIKPSPCFIRLLDRRAETSAAVGRASCCCTGPIKISARIMAR
jgi:hypothetical protein